MEVFEVGKGRVSLGQREFVGQGGEAAVYARGDRAYKVYTDPARMIPPAKIQELGALSLPNIVRPEAVLLDAQNRPVGYAMRRVGTAHVLCQAFNRAFRDRHRLTPDRMLALVRKLQEGVQHVHDRGCLVVDLNEMNFLLDPKFREVLFIDVDSYQTPSFPATAIMESIRDRHATAFSPGTDWFSFAVVSFQMLVGIHPYRGKHPTLTDLDSRMRQNVSVLNPQVTVPKVCYPFDVVPPVYLDWYRALFEHGKRLAPPADVRGTVTLPAPVPVPAGSDRLILRELARLPGEVLFPIPAVGPDAAVTSNGLFVKGRRHLEHPELRAALSPRMEHLVAGRIVAGRLELFDVTAGRPIPDVLEVEALSVSDGRFLVKQGMTLAEVDLVELPAGVRAVLRPVGNAMEQATQLFEGVALQSLLGTWYASLFPRAGECHSVRLAELDGYQVVEARFENRVLGVIAVRKGQYDRFLFRFDEKLGSHDVRVTPNVTYAGLNFAVLDSGVAVLLNEAEELELFSNRPGSTTLQTFSDPAVAGGRLFKHGTQLLLARGDRLYSLSMK